MLKKSPQNSTPSYQKLMDSGDSNHPEGSLGSFFLFFNLAEILPSKRQIKSFIHTQFTTSHQSYMAGVRRHTDK